MIAHQAQWAEQNSLLGIDFFGSSLGAINRMETYFQIENSSKQKTFVACFQSYMVLIFALAVVLYDQSVVFFSSKVRFSAQFLCKLKRNNSFQGRFYTI